MQKEDCNILEGILAQFFAHFAHLKLELYNFPSNFVLTPMRFREIVIPQKNLETVTKIP